MIQPASPGRLLADAIWCVSPPGAALRLAPNPPPQSKVATNSTMAKRMVEDMDVDAGTMLSNGDTLEQKGQEIYDLFLRVASGEQIKI